ncbi:MAG: 2,3,4,5-tetrahydropyridine-2,6-dicarboxylate N-succinyltransferase [Bacteroidota bacterium]|nr:2,3,4,5-tetrahydropyridine-2,6-dicarboxylate N-succinyltransferase [Bacteroidota bacterium]MDP4229429.1 2,3,4,5-tetrahydropyridine-2,6-dicarboxylate N-succinyltransferase [Bacteroidota bacterium]MDP4235935.1 2,3,4,5-tetrahydropyridine-2,6-dicarboxylate N-succinyltransferase [Bacteroidota bacterium]
MSLHDRFASLLTLSADELASHREEALNAFSELRKALNTGSVRSAEPDSSSTNGWKVNTWVKQGILLGFKLGRLAMLETPSPWFFSDKDTLPVRHFLEKENVRVVPGGSTIRDGAFIAPGVIVMPPAYINIGAYVGTGSLVDSHALVGSCAQLGERVHLSAAAQIGGVLEPAGAMPVIIEDDVLIGGNCGVYEGCIVKKRAVLASGVILTGSTPVYDLVNSKIIRRSSENEPLVIPEGAVIVAGSRSVGNKSDFAQTEGLSLYTPVIIKYRDEKTDARTALEGALR